MPRKILKGVVVSNVNDKTAKVEVQSIKVHPIYKKRIRVSKRYLAHDENNTVKVGDKVQIQECAPISKKKTWKVIK